MGARARLSCFTDLSSHRWSSGAVEKLDRCRCADRTSGKIFDRWPLGAVEKLHRCRAADRTRGEVFEQRRCAKLLRYRPGQRGCQARGRVSLVRAECCLGSDMCAGRVGEQRGRRPRVCPCRRRSVRKCSWLHRGLRHWLYHWLSVWLQSRFHRLYSRLHGWLRNRRAVRAVRNRAR